jgi:hypothetical protein
VTLRAGCRPDCGCFLDSGRHGERPRRVATSRERMAFSRRRILGSREKIQLPGGVAEHNPKRPWCLLQVRAGGPQQIRGRRVHLSDEHAGREVVALLQDDGRLLGSLEGEPVRAVCGLLGFFVGSLSHTRPTAARARTRVLRTAKSIWSAASE